MQQGREWGAVVGARHVARGKKYPQADLLSAVSEPLGVQRNALVTFPKYVLSMKWCHSDNSTATQNSNMAASNRKQYY